jgi:hypothetical protein
LRDFADADGGAWHASVLEDPGTDYKGRFYLVLSPQDAGDEPYVTLEDVRWNSERAARRSLETMSEVELRRRLRQALGRVARP